MEQALDFYTVRQWADWPAVLEEIQKKSGDIFILDRATVADPKAVAGQLRKTARALEWDLCAAVTISEFDLLGGKGESVLSAGRCIISPLGSTAERANNYWGLLPNRVQPAPPEGVESIWGSAVYITRNAWNSLGGLDATFLFDQGPGSVMPNLAWDDFCLRARLKGMRIGYDPLAQATVSPTTAVYLGRNCPAYEAWHAKWKWNPFLPNVYHIRERWQGTVLVKPILDDMLESWSRPGADLPQVEAVMLTENALDKLRLCLGSLAKTDYPPEKLKFKLLLNASRDDVVDELKQIKASGFKFDLEWERAPVNVGVPAGLNWLMSSCTAPVVVRLDDDIELSPDWLREMVGLLQRYPFCGAVQPSWRLPRPGLPPINLPPLRLHPNYASSEPAEFSPPEDSIHATNFLAGACVVYRKRAVDRAGGFDLTFSPTQNEDVDHGLKVRQQGYDLLVHGKVVAVHHTAGRFGGGYLTGRTQLHQRLILHSKWGRAFAILETALDQQGRIVEA